MRILAVIPARAGSKGIPNKNIRLINGKPMIVYTIERAKQSCWITDIVVTTDSPEIHMIAKQIGVRSKERPAKLCGDDVTLDAVVYDAIDGQEADYIVTLQPTSPTMTEQTLDKAISYCVEQNLDTVISVINHPHLAWVEECGKKVPAYQTRLNRQELPPYYMETGAFMISKRYVVTPTTRIGQNVDVFEVPECEAVDINTFEDLKTAEAILSKKKVGIYVNGNNQRGMGHVYRALELADEFSTAPDLYYDSNQTDRRVFGTTTHRLIPVNGIGELLPILQREQYDLFINDILSTSVDYMIAVRNALPRAKIVNIEDDGEGVIKADLVINALYEHSDLPQIMAGEAYYIASKRFLLYDSIAIKERVERVFICFGGADPQNYTDRLLSIIARETYRDVQFTVVLGRSKENVAQLMTYEQYPNITVFHDVVNIPELMAACDIGITSRGRTGFELAMLGIPTIAMAQNAREEKHGFVDNAHGFTYLGFNPGDMVIEAALNRYLTMSQEERLDRQKKLLSYDLKGGRKRVMGLLNQL